MYNIKKILKWLIYSEQSNFIALLGERNMERCLFQSNFPRPRKKYNAKNTLNHHSMNKERYIEVLGEACQSSSELERWVGIRIVY